MSSPSDPINFGVIAPSIVSLVPYFLYLINSSFLHGQFQADKHAFVRPILKKPALDPSLCCNYRPISLLSFSSKLIESAIFSQLSPFICNALDSHQSGFRPSYCTESVLISVSQGILSSFASRCSVLLVLLDLSSAFDLVDHEILLDDLSSLGVSGSALSLLRSYLMHRSFSVQNNSSVSESLPLSSGVPQGSILGPLLFNLYMSSLCPVLRQRSIPFQIYADDIQFFIPCPSSDLSLLSNILSDISNWTSSRCLLLNTSKSEFLVLHPPRLSPPLLPLSLSVSVKNLGVIFDSSLSFSSNILNTARTCRLILRSLYPIRSCLDQASSIKLIQSLIFFRIDYCSSLHFNCHKSSLKHLQRIINQSCRFVIYPSYCRHTSPFLYKFRWLPIKPRIH